MATHEFNTRIKLKRDTSANWESHNPVLLNGEQIIVDTSNGNVRMKTGDGVKTYSQLPFDDEKIGLATVAKTGAYSDLSGTPTSFPPAAHNHLASSIISGTLSGAIVANASSVGTLSVKQIRNIYSGSDDMTAGVSALSDGDIYLCYE